MALSLQRNGSGETAEATTYDDNVANGVVHGIKRCTT